MNDTKIMNAFAEIAGLSQEEALSQMPLARLANCRVTGNLRPSYDGSQEELLTMVAASLMNLWYSESQASGGPTGTFSGNGYTISRDSGVQTASAEALYNRFRGEAVDILKDDGDFFFSYAKEEDNEK